MERTTSFAKSVEGLHHEPSALDRVRFLRDQIISWFHREPEKATERASEGSRMVQTDAPALQPTPTSPLRTLSDRQAAYSRLAAERAQGRRSIRSAELRHSFHDRTKDTGQDRGR